MTKKLMIGERLLLAATSAGLLPVAGAIWFLSFAPASDVHRWSGLLRAGGSLIAILALTLIFFLAHSHPAEAQRRRRTQRLNREDSSGREIFERLPVASYMAPLEDQAGCWSVSEELEILLGYNREVWENDRRFWSKLLHVDDRERVLAERSHYLDAGDHFLSEYRIMTREGRPVWVRDEAVIVREPASDSLFLHGVMIDITERKQAEQALEHQALHDRLTDLPNRTLLQDRLQQATIGSRRESRPIALLLMDLDRFKEINDTFGHRYGDLVLRQVVSQLRRVLRESDTIARLGGDEFAVLLPGVDAAGAILTVEKILQILRQPVSAENHTLDVGASIGVALFPEHGNDADTLLQRADVAMYAAKRADSGFAFYEQAEDPYSPGRLAMVRQLRDAIERDELELHYQPKARLSTGQTRHVEALVRWRHPDRGYLPPEEIIALAEHAGLMKSLSTWVLDAALRQCRDWHSAGLDVCIAVNLSARTLHDPGLVAMIERFLQEWHVPAERLEVEITEGALMIDPARAMETLTRLHDMGVCISIDDFGTGYSSLSYLTRLPADQIKIDKSFVLDMARNDDSAFIVRSVIDLGHNLSLEVVAEGVENQETWDLLDGMGCDVAQGFHLSHPLPAADLGNWLRSSATPVFAG